MDHRDVDVPTETLDLLKVVGTPTLSSELLKAGYRNHFMIGPEPLAVTPNQRMVGRARTLRFINMREDLLEAQYDSLTASPHRIALEDVGPGEVLVIDAGGSLEAAVVGDMFTRRIMQRSATGLVIDGVLRDLSAIRGVGLPVFARGMHGSGITRALMSVGMDEPVQCGGVPVIRGDVLVGDEDGVVVIPPQIAAELARDAYDHQEEEIWIRQKLKEGFSLHEVYPPNEQMSKVLAQWKASRTTQA